MSKPEVQYVLDEHGDMTGVIVPIALWKEIAAELETSHLLGSDAMRSRLLEARERQEAMALEEALDRLGIE